MALGRCLGFLGPLGLGGVRGEWPTGPSGYGFQGGRVEESPQVLCRPYLRAGEGKGRGADLCVGGFSSAASAPQKENGLCGGRK